MGIGGTEIPAWIGHVPKDGCASGTIGTFTRTCSMSALTGFPFDKTTFSTTATQNALINFFQLRLSIMMSIMTCKRASSMSTRYSKMAEHTRTYQSLLIQSHSG